MLGIDTPHKPVEGNQTTITKTLIIMKKQLLLLVMMLLPMVAGAETVEIDGIYYELISKIKEAIVKSSSYSGIPTSTMPRCMCLRPLSMYTRQKSHGRASRKSLH